MQLADYVRPHCLSQIMKKSSVFLNLSIEDSGPMTLVEAVKNQLPFVTFNVGIAKDIKDKTNYKYIHPKVDAKLIINSILQIFEMNAIQYYNLRIEIEYIYQKMFQYDKHMNKLLNLIEEISKSNFSL